MLEIQNILKYWHKIEHFSPYEPDEINSENFRRIAILNDLCLPWNEEVDYERVYTVYLGVFRMDVTTEIIETKFGKDKKPEDNPNFSCICTFKLNNNIEYCPNSFRISALPWAVGKIIHDQWSDEWQEDFKKFEDPIIAQIACPDGEMDYETFEGIKKSIADKLGWDVPFCDAWLYIDERKIKRDANGQKFEVPVEEVLETLESKDSAEAEEVEEEEPFDLDEELAKKNELLNSFYARDIEKLIGEVKAGNFGKGFSNFILGNPEKKEIDIENDVSRIKEVLSPRNYPLGRWPSNNSLSLMQQVAVNLSRSQVADELGLFSVNGPPGTGKTTLLRDVIASIIVDRACKLSKLKHPDDAFIKGELVKLPGYEFLRIHHLKEEFRDYGIIIASNNNGAVQNITQELPVEKAIPQKYNQEKYHYFSKQANYAFEKKIRKKCWAFISAVLGNTKNCNDFSNGFWDVFDKSEKNKSMRKLLQDKKLKVLSWEKAVQNFNEKLGKTVAERDRLESYNENLKLKEIIDIEIRELKQQQTKSGMDLREASENELTIKKRIEIVETQLEKLSAEVGIYKSRVKWYHKCLPFLPKSKKLFADVEEAENRQTQKLRLFSELNEELIVAEDIRRKHEKAYKGIVEAIESSHARLKRVEEVLGEAKKLLGVNFPDADYWRDFENNQNAQINCPWTYNEFNELREQLFLEALQLHKAFALNSEAIRTHNMNLFYNLLKRKLSHEDEKAYASELFQSFFLLVPVISTTFASISRLLKHIGREEIAWLMIDEAGQGTPQSAAGAIWRAKRTLIIGDPLQIEPVVTTPNCVLKRFSELYSVPLKFTDKELSIQVLGDKVNPYGTKRGSLWVGCPLRVHRRCISPMFEIANTIAYRQKMICATRPETEDFIIPKSQWLNIGGKSDKPHYVEKQGKLVYKIVLKAFLESNSDFPSIYVITPFVTVKNELLKLFYENLSEDLESKAIYINKNRLYYWIRSSIGTVHTFQGKETKMVILCLGVDSDLKGCGAIQWASRKPNLLNVAATRAMYRLLIVGDAALWKDEENFKVAYEMLNQEV